MLIPSLEHKKESRKKIKLLNNARKEIGVKMLKINPYGKKLKLIQLKKEKDLINLSKNSIEKTAALVKITAEILKEENKWKQFQWF